MTKVNINKADRIIDMNNLLREISKNYEFEQIQFKNIQIQQYHEGYMNTCLKLSLNQTEPIIVVIYNSNKYNGEKGKKRLDNCYIAAEILNQNEIACRIPIKNKAQERLTHIKPYKKSPVHLMGIYQYLYGKTLPWEAYTRRHLISLGKNMRIMHKTWEVNDEGALLLEHWQDYLKRDLNKLKAYFTKNKEAINQKLELKINIDNIDSLIKNIEFPHQPLQLIHYDFVRGNVLFSEKKENNSYPITGILDFEKVMYAPVEIDLARTISFLLVDCKYKTDEQVIFYFLDQGYNQKKSHKIIQIGDLREAMIYFWLRDLWKYLTNNPYEALKQNYHYNQTKKRLVESNLIELT